jgi:hypothetical protein
MKLFTVIVIVQRALWKLLRHFYSLFPYTGDLPQRKIDNSTNIQKTYLGVSPI